MRTTPLGKIFEIERENRDTEKTIDRENPEFFTPLSKSWRRPCNTSILFIL
jgi:hypothetical protein